MAMAGDSDDQFRASCNDSPRYPCNLVTTRHPPYALRDWSQRLEVESGRIFDDDESGLDFVEAYDGTGFHCTTIDDDKALEAHLRQNRKDPRFRYVSVEAYSSLDCLNCSPSMFKYLCSYHQIPPSFLDSVFSFGITTEPLDYGLAAFSSDDTLLVRDQSLLSIPSLGRSGREIRHSYLLRSMEKSRSRPTWSWGIRQLAVYHSFDVLTGRSTWVTLKGNELIKERLKDSVFHNPAFHPGAIQTVHEAFAATLEMHLLILDWCDENWRWCINDLEEATRDIVKKAKTAKIDAEPHFSDIPEDIKQTVFRSNTSNSKAMSRSNTLVGSIQSGAHKLMKRASFGKGPATPQKISFGSGPGVGTPPKADTAAKNRLDNLVVLDMFSFKEMQRLQDIAEKIQEALLVIKLNSVVVSQIGSYYRNLMESRSIQAMESIREGCQNDLASFLFRVESTETSLSIRKEQLESLLVLARDGKTLYDGILQYRSVQISRVYAESAHESTRKMEKIFHKTEEETISMHIITVVTLVFLPGTFIATFLQSGIFQWNQLDTGGATWLFKRDAFGMFATISCVMMTVTFLVWFVVLQCLRRRSRRRLEIQNEKDGSLQV